MPSAAGRFTWALLVLLGCGGDDDAGSALALGTQLEGIYELTERDLNLNGCDPIGANVLGHGFLALYTWNGAASVISCAGILSCKATVRDIRAQRGVSYNFHISFYEQDGATTLTGLEITTRRSGGSCQNIMTDAVLERTEDTQIEVVARYWHGAEYPADGNGICYASEGPEPALDEPCNEFESMTAERVADLED